MIEITGICHAFLAVNFIRVKKWGCRAAVVLLIRQVAEAVIPWQKCHYWWEHFILLHTTPLQIQDVRVLIQLGMHWPHLCLRLLKPPTVP